MTGRELIIYILENGLEDEQVIKDGNIIGHMTDINMAAHLGYGLATVRAYIEIGALNATKLGETYYIPLNAPTTKNVTKD